MQKEAILKRFLETKVSKLSQLAFLKITQQ